MNRRGFMKLLACTPLVGLSDTKKTMPSGKNTYPEFVECSVELTDNFYNNKSMMVCFENKNYTIVYGKEQSLPEELVERIEKHRSGYRSTFHVARKWRKWRTA